MRIFTCFSRRAWVAAVIAGVLGGVAGNLAMPILPRQVLALNYPLQRIAISGDFQYVAVAQRNVHNKHEHRVEVQLWEAMDDRMDFSSRRHSFFFSHDEFISDLAFDDNRSIFAILTQDKLHCFRIPTGEKIDAVHISPLGEAEADEELAKTNANPGLWLVGRRLTKSTNFVSDSVGKLFILTTYQYDRLASIHDPLTGEVVARWNLSEHFEVNAFGGLIEVCSERFDFREIPSGITRQKLPRKNLNSAIGYSRPVTGEFTATSDGRTLVLTRNQMHVVADGVVRDLDLPADKSPAISPDGKLLAVRVIQLHAYPNWLTRVLGWIGVTRPDSLFVVYDLDTATTIATFPLASSAHFSRDGRSFALVTDRGIEFYDLPLRKPWWRIGGIGLAAGVGVLGIAWLRKWRAGIKREPSTST